MDRLSDRTLKDVAQPTPTPGYDRAESRTGVVHLGPGAFFRAHQMSVYERLRESDASWGVCTVALRGAAVRDALVMQDGLYSLTELGEGRTLRVLGALAEALWAREEPERVLGRLAAEATRLVTLTVTEKGYHLGPDGALDPAAAEIRRDLDVGHWPVTAAGWVLAGLRARRARGLRPFVAMSCDNLPGASGKLKSAVLALAHARGEIDLADWIEAEAVFPDTVVDSITPAADAAFLRTVAGRLGVTDAAAVQRESFLQWVIDEAARPDLSALSDAGAIFSKDVEGYGRAKLRLLNGAHSSLAYLGLLAGLQTVRQAVEEPRLGGFVERLMRQDLAETLDPPEGFDTLSYIGAVLDRFRNPEVEHRLAQIAADGSVKLPPRLLDATEAAVHAGGRLDRLALPVAAWMRFVCVAARRSGSLDDPAAHRLLDLGDRCTGDARADVDAFLTGSAIFRQSLQASGDYRAAVERAYAALGAADPLCAIGEG